uniref:C2H2-type domain-containing protein n=1 Tax=Strongyloides papillosus TaxID=174720 RepID=A0A0N5BNH1_STREA
MSSKSFSRKVNTSGVTASSRENDLSNFLDSFWRCRIYDPSMDTKYGGNNKCDEKTVNFGNDLIKIPGPMAYNVGDVTCTLCNKKVNSNYIIRRDHIIKEHADVIIDNIAEKTESSKANYLYTIFMVIRTAFPNCKVYSDIQCIVCTKSVKTTAGMHTHMGTVHKLAPYQCPYRDCHLTVCYKNKIIDHLRNVHNKVVDLKEMDCVDRETRILKNFEDSRKEFFAKIVENFFPVDIEWYEDDLKDKNGHVYNIFDNLQKERLVIKNNNVVEKVTSSSKSSLKSNEKNDDHPRRQIKQRENEAIEIDLSKRKFTTNDSRYVEVSSSNSDKRNPIANCGSSQRSVSLINLKDNKTARNSNYERMNNKVKDNFTDKNKSERHLNEANCGRNVSHNNKIPLRKPDKTGDDSSNGSRKRSLLCSPPSTDRTRNLPGKESKKPTPKGYYNPLSEACPVKKARIDRYTKKIANPESLRTNTDKIHYSRSEEEDNKIRGNKSESSSDGVTKDDCNIRKVDNTKSVIGKKEVSTTSHRDTSNNIMTSVTKNETENTKKYSIKPKKRVPSTDKDLANNKEVGKVNGNQSGTSIGLGTSDSPICIDDDEDSPSEVEDKMHSGNNTKNNVLRNEEKSNNNKVGFESIYQTLERFETGKDNSTFNPLFTNATEAPVNINASPDSNMRPRDPRLNKINKFSGK